MKKGNITIHDLGFGHDRYGIEKKGTYPFLVRVDIEDLKDLHSLIGELLETETVKEKCYDSIHKAIVNGQEICINVSCPCNQPSNSEKEECCNYTEGLTYRLHRNYCPEYGHKEEVKEGNCKRCGHAPDIVGEEVHTCFEEEPTTPEKKPRLHCFDCNTVHELRDCTKDRLPSERITEIEKELMAKQPNPMEEVENYAIYCANMKARATVQYLDEQYKKK